MQTCLTARSHSWNSWNTSNRETKQLGMLARFVQSCRYSNLWTPDDEQNGHSKHVECTKIVE